jgi:tetratricopeptide (TPR) repeat protein
MSLEAGPIFTFDLHDGAFHAWRTSGVRAASLVHIDAHHDAAAPGGAPIDIGNFVGAALAEGMVSRVDWIVPDPLWQSASGRQFVRRELRGLGDSRINAGPVASIRPAEGPVLLDLDVDYLALADPRRKGSDALPWCWPDDLTSGLRDLVLAPELITIASSVTGGFTPILWKHLSAEIALRLAGDRNDDRLACYERLRTAAEEARQGRLDAAIAASEAAVTLCPAEGAGHYHLASHLLAAGRAEEARASFARTLNRDPSYRTPFRTRAPSHLRHGRWAAAREACESALALDPDDPYARYGLGVVALHEGRLAEARNALEATVAADSGSIEGWRALGQTLAAEGETRAAIKAYERALSLALAGAVPASGPWFGTNVERRMVDHLHGRDHAAIGDLQTRIGDLQGARASFIIATALESGRARGRLSC